MRDLLTPDELQAALAALPTWSVVDGQLTRTVTSATFPAAIALVDAVALAAEDLDHHPDIDIRWRTVRFALVTHSAGGLTELDAALAARIETLASGAVDGGPA